MKIISFITEAEVIRKILEYLGLWEEEAIAERVPPVIRGRRYEPVSDGRLQFGKPAAPVH